MARRVDAVRAISPARTMAKHLILFLLLPTCVVVLAVYSTFAQGAIPPGTVLPIRLNNSLSLKKSKPRQQITGRVMQDVPLGGGNKVRDGAKIIGHVIAVSPATNQTEGQIVFKFDSIELGHTLQLITTNLRALASPLAVDDAQLPVYGGDRGTPSTAYTTTQIGGEVVYRGGGHVERGETIVGEPVYGEGVLAVVAAAQGEPCRGAIAGKNQPQAVWLFSSDAGGLYGYSRLAIKHAGRSNPVGEIVLTSDDPNMIIRSGSAMLLRVDCH
jgi:hypothetical protein